MKRLTDSDSCIGNVLMVADYRAPRSGNFIASLLDLADILSKQGSNTVFLFPDKENGYSWTEWIEKKGYSVYLIKDQISAEEKILTIQHIVEKYHISLVHSHFGYLSRVLLQNHKRFGVKLLFHDHMDFSELGSQKKQHLATMKRGLMYRFHDAYCISVMEKKDRYYWTAGANRHWYIPNGLSLQRAEIDSLSREERRAEIGISESEKLLLFLGWDMHRKGLDIAAKAVQKYREYDSSLKLGVIGIGSNGEPGENAQQFLRGAGIDPFADWIIYMHSYEDIFALNRAVDCYISSSRAEAFAYGILEAISQETPVVVSDIEGTSWSWEYSNCHIYRTEDADDCLRALKEAIKTGRINSNAQAMVKKYGSEVWCNRVIEVYKVKMQEKLLFTR